MKRERVYITIDKDAMWDRYHDGKTTPNDVRKLLLAYDALSIECDQLRRDSADREETQSTVSLPPAQSTSGPGLEETRGAYAPAIEANNQAAEYADQLKIERQRSNELRAALGEVQLLLAPAGAGNWEQAIKMALQIIEEAQRG
jgi:hypothetical protein